MSTTKIENFKWETNGEGVTVTAYTGDESCVVIPETIDEKPVKGIGAFAFSRNSKLTSLTLPQGLNSIGVYAFQKCSSLSGIFIPNSVTTIGNGAFYNCHCLSFVALSSRLESIGDHAFFGCNDLESVTLPKTLIKIGAYAFADCGLLKKLYYPESKNRLDEICGENWIDHTDSLKIHYNTLNLISADKSCSDSLLEYYN